MACTISFLFFLLSCYFIITIHGVQFEEQPHLMLPSKRLRTFTHLHFYFHDILDTQHPTTVKIITPPSDSPGAFGATYMVDNPLTEKPDLNSTLIGRAQGTYALASQHDFGFKMDINFVFTKGTYKGSTLSMLGRNAILEQVREMAIVGGTGFFRFAHGYALAKTVWYNSTSGDATEEFNVTVYHF